MGRKRKREEYRIGEYRLDWRGDVARVDFYDASAGKRKRVILGSRGQKLSDEDAKTALQGFVDARSAIDKLTADYTCGQLWEMWLTERAKDGFSNEIYKHNWKPQAAHFAHRRPSELKTDDFRSYAQSRFDLGRAPQTVHTELVRLRACLKWAFDNNFIPKPVKVWAPSRGPGRELAMTFDEAKAILDQAGDPHVHLFILLAMTTGARHTAILELTWDRVDWDANTVSYEVDEDPNPMHKNYKKGRATAPFGLTVRTALLKAYRGRQTDHVIEHGGKRLKSVKDGFANAVWRAGLNPEYTPHTLRHSVVTWAIEGGSDYHHCARLVGHADSRTTELVYDHSSAELARPIVDRIESRFAALPANEVVQRKKGVKPRSKRTDLGTM